MEQVPVAAFPKPWLALSASATVESGSSFWALMILSWALPPWSATSARAQARWPSWRARWPPAIAFAKSADRNSPTWRTPQVACKYAGSGCRSRTLGASSRSSGRSALSAQSATSPAGPVQPAPMTWPSWRSLAGSRTPSSLRSTTSSASQGQRLDAACLSYLVVSSWRGWIIFV